MGDLSIQDLVVEYSSGGYAVRPLDGFNLDVAAGSLVILLGPSGCGKTTLLSCLGGILQPSEGAIKFGDVDVTSLDARGLSKYRRETVGIVFQAFNLVPSLTALENVMVPLRSAGMSRAAAREKAEQLLARVGLADRVTHRPSDLSGGQQQRVAVARAIALDPPLILADEPTAHLDFIQVEEVLRLIRELASGDRMVVVATHDSRILPLADRVVELVPDFAESNRPPSTVQLPAGEVLFEEGTMGDCIYVMSRVNWRLCANWPGAVRNCSWSQNPAITSASSVRCFTCRARRRRGRAPMRRSSATRWRRSGNGSVSAAFAISSNTARWTSTSRQLRRNQAEQQVRPDGLNAVETPALRVGDRQHTDVVDRGYRAAQQNWRDIGQDPMDRSRPQEGARECRAALDEHVCAVRQRLDHLVWVPGADHHRP